MNDIFNNKSEYLKEFQSEQIDTPSENEGKDTRDQKQMEALKMALDIRKFEIDMYWKRATYFWTFIGASFAGYFLLINANVSTAGRLQWGHILIVSVLGFLFSFSWFLVNRGSKFWQNNWERHVDYLEDEIMGPLYKTVTNPLKIKYLNPFTEYPLSVSKINQLLSFVVTFIWTLLINESLRHTYTSIDICGSILIELISIAIIVWIYYLTCRSKLVDNNFKNGNPIFVKRNIE